MRWDSNVKELAQSPRLDVVDQSSRKLPAGKFTGCFIHANMNANFRIPGIMPKPGIIRIHAIQCKRNVHDAFEKWKKCSKVRKCTSASETLCSAKSLMNEHSTRVFFFFRVLSMTPCTGYGTNTSIVPSASSSSATAFFQRTERLVVPTPSFGGPNAERCPRLCANGCVPLEWLNGLFGPSVCAARPVRF